MNKHWITLSALLLIVSACDSTTTSASAHTGLKAEPAAAASSGAAKNVVLTDISGHWGETSIQKAVKKGYVDGYEDATFRAEKEVSRAEFIKMVLTAMGPDTTAAKPAVDSKQAGSAKELTVSAGEPANWYDSYVQKAQEIGIQRKEDFKEGDMNTSMTRLEMARIAVRATDPTLQKPEVRIDDRSVMYNATKKGLIQGLEAGDLAPDNTTTRAQSVTIIERVLTVNSGGTLEVDKYALGNAELALKKTNIFTVMPEFFGGKGFPWNMDNLTIETSDGLYKGVVTRVVAVDLEDPNDPNRGIMGDLNELVWRGGGNEYFNVLDYPDSYLFVVETHTEFNNDESYTLYPKRANGLDFSLYGILRPDSSALSEGKLNSWARLYNKNDTQKALKAMILPKHGIQTDGSITLRLRVTSHPSAGPNYKDVFELVTPKLIE
ncbi:S-layer homology domain-containing protein [Paenibacillus oceani]|uniref:S-layer homology domain-containing protein n=1 Tax=Paenibacillus oceani TaxID=2772510 RepID=A0A927CCG8_9BACL|nr:S-layer homology domain-containing protein [Paenibacillus oceani]MBD2863320.1 S-layer homology domain-containing protein [Paenibacillus oceani]